MSISQQSGRQGEESQNRQKKVSTIITAIPTHIVMSCFLFIASLSKYLHRTILPIAHFQFIKPPSQYCWLVLHLLCLLQSRDIRVQFFPAARLKLVRSVLMLRHPASLLIAKSSLDFVYQGYF